MDESEPRFVFGLGLLRRDVVTVAAATLPPI